MTAYKRRVKVADKLTLLRIILAPVYAAFFFLLLSRDAGAVPCAVVVVLLVISIELSDIFDGYAARRLNQASDWGKIADPLADVISRLTYFMCFAVAGLMYPWVLFVIFFRELGMILIRLSLAQKGLIFGAGWAGKIKTAAYGLTGALGSVYLLAAAWQGRNMNREAFSAPFGTSGTSAEFVLLTVFRAASVLSAGLAVLSMAWYLVQLKRNMR